jgi:hypothetical protein
MPQGQPKGKPANSPVTQGDAAAMLNVSERTVRAAAAVHNKKATPANSPVSQGDAAAALLREFAEHFSG